MWIESHDELPTHPKTIKAARRLDVPVPHAIGLLHCLWYWCLTHRPDGRLTDMDAEDIAIAAGWDGDGEAFVKALTAAGWLDDGDILAVHDWWDGAGKSIKRRKYATARQRRARESQSDDAEVTPDTDDGHAEVTDESQTSHAEVTRDTRVSHGADRDRDRDINPSPEGNGEPFERRLANELRSNHGCEFQSRETLYDAFHDLLTQALERLPEDRHHPTSMGIIGRFVERAQGYKLSKEARAHTANRVRNHSPTAVLRGYGEAVNWGAGVTRDYAGDPLALSKYVAGVLTNGRKART